MLEMLYSKEPHHLIFFGHKKTNSIELGGMIGKIVIFLGSFFI